jgi:hypothetical protein
VIITTIFGIATTIFVRVTATSMTTTELNARQLLKAYAENTERNQLLYNERITRGDFHIQRTSTPCKDYPNLWQIGYAIYDRRDSLLAGWNSFILDER